MHSTLLSSMWGNQDFRWRRKSEDRVRYPGTLPDSNKRCMYSEKESVLIGRYCDAVRLQHLSTDPRRYSRTVIPRTNYLELGRR